MFSSLLIESIPKVIDIIALLNYLSTRILQLQIVFPYSPFVDTPLYEEPQLRWPRGGFTPPFVLRISSFLIPQVISRVTLDDSDDCHDITVEQNSRGTLLPAYGNTVSFNTTICPWKMFYSRYCPEMYIFRKPNLCLCPRTLSIPSPNKKKM